MSTRFSGDATAYTATAGLPVPGGATVCFWLKMSVDRVADQVFWGCQNSADTAHLYFGGDTARVLTMSDDGSSITAPGGAMAVGTWYKIAFVWTSATAFTIYKAPDGAALASTSGTLALAPTNVSKMWLGASRYTGSWWNGAMQNYRQWSAALTADELEAEFASPVALRSTNLVRSHNMVLPPAVVSSTVPDDIASNTLTTGTTVAAYEQASVASQVSSALTYAASAAAFLGTWSNVANAAGLGTGTYATWTSSTANDSARLDLTYSLSTMGVPANAIINGVYFQYRGFVSNATLVTLMTIIALAATPELTDGTGTVGAGTVPRPTAVAESAQSNSGLTVPPSKCVSQSLFKMAVSAFKNATASSSTVSVDRLGIVVDWSMDEEPGRPMFGAA